jgi:hypothetical protein
LIYIVRCISGASQAVVTFRGALLELALCGPDAAVYSITGKWVAGRKVTPC